MKTLTTSNITVDTGLKEKKTYFLDAQRKLSILMKSGFRRKRRFLKSPHIEFSGLVLNI